MKLEARTDGLDMLPHSGRIGLLPPVDGPRPISLTMPSPRRSPTTSLTVVRVSPVLRATSARLIGPKS